MNEYRDQETWVRVEAFTDQGWEFVADSDTQVEADGVCEEYSQLDPDLKTRTRRMHGLA